MVYAIYADTERSAYVGSTARTAYSRYAVHRGQLRGGIHHCSALQAAWCRLGEDAFRMVILEQVTLSANLLDAEYRQMEQVAAEGYTLYNPQALRCLGCSGALRAHGRVRYCSVECRVKAWRAKRRPAAQEPAG
jgi:hypothetical protein